MGFFENQAPGDRLDRVVVHNQDRWHRVSVKAPSELFGKMKVSCKRLPSSVHNIKTLSFPKQTYAFWGSIRNDTPSFFSIVAQSSHFYAIKYQKRPNRDVREQRRIEPERLPAARFSQALWCAMSPPW